MEVTLKKVKEFWEKNPLCSAAIDAEIGSKEFFEKYDRLREINEPAEFSYNLHEYPSFKNKRVLDVGCGNGYVLERYAREGADVYGVDITETAVEMTRRRLVVAGMTGALQVSNAEKLPFGSNFFDCVCSMGVLHHTPNPEKGIEEIYRVLKPNGRFMLMLYHKDSILNKWNFTFLRWFHPRYFGMARQKMVDMVDGVDNPKGSMYTREEMLRMLSEFRHVYLFSRLVQGWMIYPFGRFLPQTVLDMFESRMGWFLYAKGWK